MFVNSIKGQNVLFPGDIPRGSVILITGKERALKSGFVMDMMSNYLAGNNEQGLYATIEGESYPGTTLSSVIKKVDRLHVFDYKDIIYEWKNEELDLINVTENMINFYRKKYDNLTVFAIDSLNTLYQASNQVNLRENIYRFFTMLRDNDLTSFLIMETQSPDMKSPECSLADGIIEVGTVRCKKNVNMYIQIKKWTRLIITGKASYINVAYKKE
ncbi:KaiC [uncultured archaeon]|nr:KaiC [uncultured archaeon]